MSKNQEDPLAIGGAEEGQGAPKATVEAKLVAKMAEANDKKEPKVRLPPHLRMCHRVDFIDIPIPQRHHDPSLAIRCAEAAVTAFIP